MDITFDKQSVVVFDLDDTLYNEIDYLKSAYRHIADTIEQTVGHNVYLRMLRLHREKAKVFEILIKDYQLTYSVSDLLSLYRFHKPVINCFPYVNRFLLKLKMTGCKIALITDGRSVSQRNKLEALGIYDFFDEIVISEAFGSEKPNLKNYLHCSNFFGTSLNYYYIGDNVKKDFITPNQLGWITIGLKDNGKNIHAQSLEMPVSYLPKYFISNFKELCF
jgi:putative hydrolase of the HAD superfamily